MRYGFSSGEELLTVCEKENISISEAMICLESEQSLKDRETLISAMRENLTVMRESIKEGLSSKQTMGMFLGNDAEKLLEYAPKSVMGNNMAEIIAASMAVVEVNASMGKIVAAPTAGASGILPGVLIKCAEQRGIDDDALIKALFNAGAIGMIIAKNASLSGAYGGCQAETGSAAAMAASALVEMLGGSVKMSLNAAAIAIKNILGLVCDPVGGLVECPCMKRNAIGAANAIVACDLSLANIESLIPFDEVVGAMKSVGRLMNSDLRETARGGLAATATAQKLEKELKNKENKERV